MKPSPTKKLNVKMIIGKFDPNKKLVQRKEIKLSPKTKPSPIARNKGKNLSVLDGLDRTTPKKRGKEN